MYTLHIHMNSTPYIYAYTYNNATHDAKLWGKAVFCILRCQLI